MTQVEYVTRLIEYGYFDFFGLGTDVRAALDAIETAARIDAEYGHDRDRDREGTP